MVTIGIRNNAQGHFTCFVDPFSIAEAETPNTLATSCKELTHWKRP